VPFGRNPWGSQSSGTKDKKYQSHMEHPFFGEEEEKKTAVLGLKEMGKGGQAARAQYTIGCAP